jgi:prolyl-tRNA editing enzyme YbaK/EbsC (Cys-tRNA(Pro) deacylase)
VTGGIGPLGQRRRLATVLDESALAFDTICVSAVAGSRSSSGRPTCSRSPGERHARSRQRAEGFSPID